MVCLSAGAIAEWEITDERGNIMKKKLVCMLVGMLAVGMLSGCGSAEENNAAATESTVQASDTARQDTKQYVTLGEYKGVTVNVADPAVAEDAVTSSMESTYFGRVTKENGGITDRKVEDGDTVNIDYEGKKDGVAFSGGTAQGQKLVIGSGQFIEGFEEGLIGVMPGETVDLNLKFPEEYKNNEELAGKEVVFTVTVNYILPTEMEEDVVAGMGIEGVTTLEELRQYTYDNLYAQAEQNYATEVEYAVIDAVIQNCTFAEELPQEDLDRCTENVKTNIEQQAAMYGLDGPTMIAYFYGATDYDGFVAEQAENGLKQELAIQAIADQENMNLTEEELDSMLLEKAQSYNLTTIEELIGDTDKEEFRSYFLYDKISAFLVENAVVTQE